MAEKKVARAFNEYEEIMLRMGQYVQVRDFALTTSHRELADLLSSVKREFLSEITDVLGLRLDKRVVNNKEIPFLFMSFLNGDRKILLRERK